MHVWKEKLYNFTDVSAWPCQPDLQSLSIVPFKPINKNIISNSKWSLMTHQCDMMKLLVLNTHDCSCRYKEVAQRQEYLICFVDLGMYFQKQMCGKGRKVDTRDRQWFVENLHMRLK